MNDTELLFEQLQEERIARELRAKAKRQTLQRLRAVRRTWGRAPVIGCLVAPGVDVCRYVLDNVMRLERADYLNAR
jgi:hypothetical protein